MIQLTYISSATAKMTEPEIDRLLFAARTRNAAVGVTGLLVYNGRRFLQTLEGAAEDVSAIYRRISADHRHRALVLLSSSDVTERLFGSWAMAGLRVTGDTQSAELIRQVDALTAGISDPTVQAHFRSFAAVKPDLRPTVFAA